MKWLLLCIIAAINILAVRGVASKKDKCDKCMRVEKCDLFGDMDKDEQKYWIERYPCEMPPEEDYTTLFGFAPTAKGDFICCSEDVEIEGNGEGGEYEQHRYPNSPRRRRPLYGVNGYPNNLGPAPPNRQQFIPSPPNFNGANGRNSHNFNGANGYPSGRNNNRPTVSGPYGNVPNYGSNGNARNSNGNGNSGAYQGGQCSLTSFPPLPATGCCGRDEAFGDRIAGQPNSYTNRRPAPSSRRNTWTPPAEYPQPNDPWRNRLRFSRATDNEPVEVTFENRIAGGKETELEMFPWTVLLKTTFDYGNRQSAFNCGGSIISSRYVLTAAHCVYEDGATVSDVEVTLAEYDKRTFPRDCKNVLGEGRRCIDNVVMHAETAVRHPNYDDKRLQNDIALIRLRENAPYTMYIRPICLPLIDIDNPDYYDLRLAVAGWGRNGSVTSQVKQSTVVNLVPQAECSKSYPHLTRQHLCAAGHSGEDTCKGDSGGPLMMLYEGKYFVSGVVSGKRADAPCGTAVPSLYTNVYHYLDWIKSNIKN